MSSRSRSRSSSSGSGSDSESSDERAEREAREEQRREERRERRKAARKARAQQRKELEAAIAAGKLSWMITDTINDYEKDDEEDDEDDEDSQNIVTLLGRKPATAGADLVDCSNWASLEKYLREFFEVHKSNKRVGLKMKFVSGADSRTKLAGRIMDMATMANWWAKLEEVRDLLIGSHP